MYLAHLLNSRGLFSRCATLSQDRKVGKSVSELLGRATSACVGMLRVDDLQRQCFWEFDLFKDQLPNIESRIVFNSASLVSLQNEISPILSSLRIMQDHVNGLVSKLYEAELPRSINDTVKKLDKRNLPQEIKDLYDGYWNNGGSRIRDYRILDQHYGTVSDRVFLEVSPSRRVLIIFPDNPEQKSRAEQTYQSEICGISTLRVGFDALHDFVEGILKCRSIEPSSHKTSASLEQWGDLRPFRKRELALLYEANLTLSADEKRNLNISAIRIGHLDDGRLELQKLLVSKEQLKRING